MTATVILIHGAFGNATLWAPLQRALDVRGITSTAVDLPGHGTQRPDPLASAPSHMAGIGTSDDVEAVVEVLRDARQRGPTVLMGTSRGGLMLTAVANTAPQLVDHLVYVSAWCCVTDDPQGYEQSAENRSSELGLLAELVSADPTHIGALRINWRTQQEAQLGALQSAMLHDGTRSELMSFLHAQDPEESINVDTELVVADPHTWGQVPRSYVIAEQDRAIPPALQRRFITEADALVPENPTEVSHLDSSHTGFQIHPEELAEILVGVVNKY